MVHQLRNIFGSTHHCAKHHNNGRDINFINPLECRMAAECLQYLRVYCLTDAVQMATQDKVFIGYKQFQFVTKLVNSEEAWDTLFAIIQACCPIYRILCLADIRVGSMDKMCYFVRQADRLLKSAMEKALEQWYHPLMPTMEISKCNLTKEDRDFLQGET
jgi:hypothetical protein